ncbi:MAG: FtsX-like permease family protein [Syntrophobacteraceae bacterium]|nr:FtsX-like permease family protein [Syntrophobacteraceae bacterium]
MLELLILIFRNTFRQRLRTLLTVLGMAVAILAFCLLQTVVQAWYSGVSGASPNRLVSRNAVSLIMPLPVSYRQKIMQVPGVSQVTYANWFGGIYIDEKQFFPRMAVDSQSFFDLFPELIVSSDDLARFAKHRNACIAGRKIVEKYGWKIGDAITLTGNIYPGEWRFVLQGVYRGATRSVDETQFFFRWDYLDEMVKKTMPSEAGKVGWYIVQVANPAEAGAISHAIDSLFRNSWAETLTETEKAFQLGFVAMTEAILIAVRVVSYVVIGVILVILANTMAMTSRERMPEYATLKTLGFGNRFLTALIAGESVSIALLGGILGMSLSFPVAAVFSKELGTLLPIFHIELQTLAAGFAISIAIGLLSAVLPAWRAVRTRIAEALSHVG